MKPLPSLSLTDRVENKLREFFEEHAFKPGDPLPNEMEIAENMQVSRNVVREALSRLRMLGMIETRPRKGMIMARPDILGGIERVLNPYILGKNTLKDIFELRLILEMGLAEVLFERKTAKGIKELEEIVERQIKMKSLTKEDEIEFHGKLYEMSGNETLRRFQILLFPIFDHVYKNIPKDPKNKIQDPITHKDLLNILKNGTPQEFRTAIYKHLSPYFTGTVFSY
ncbi:GntR family transcriptional regulator [Chitinophaga sp. MM2321]|uniref:FadR/GntR family transcriptional regulator n=1 Tax=Chitinophaga sp. MM2321 TaxID=3137178 RepID=UPI0032D5A4E8